MFDSEDEQAALEKIQYYIEIGAIKLVGYNEEGEAVFELNDVITKERAPELWQAHKDYVDSNLLDLYKDGLMEVEYNDNLEATFNFTEEGYQIAKSKGVIPIENIW